MARWPLVGGCCLALVALTSGCTGSDGTASSKTPASSTSAASSPTRAKPAATDLNAWAVKFCRAVRALGNTYVIEPPLNPEAHDHAEPRKLFGTSRQALGTAMKTAGQIGPTGVPGADRLTNQLRRSLNTTGPRLAAELDAGSKAKGSAVTDSAEKANRILGTIHPNSNDLFDAAQEQAEIGPVIKATMGCPTQILPLPVD